MATRTYLPLTAMWWLPVADDSGLTRSTVPAGLPVHAVVGGRVTTVDDSAVGAVVVRDDREWFHHYRHLRARSISVQEDEIIEAGRLLGVVAVTSDAEPASLLYGVTDPDGLWLDAADLVTGAIDPGELGTRAGIAHVDPLYGETPQPSPDQADTVTLPAQRDVEDPAPTDREKPVIPDPDPPRPDDDPLAGGGIPRGL